MYNVEKKFLEECGDKKVNVIMKNGFQQRGVLKDFDNDTLLLFTVSAEEALVYRNNVSTIVKL